MRTLGAGELPWLRTRDVSRMELSPVLRNTRLRAEQQRAHMRALIAVPPKAFFRGELARIPRFLVELIRVAPGPALADPAASMAHIAAGICLHLGVDPAGPRVRFEYRNERGPWSVRFVVSEDFVDTCTCDELTKSWRAEDRAALCGHLAQCPRHHENFLEVRK